MTEIYTPIKDITEDSTNWTAKVMLVERSCIRLAKLSHKPYKRYVFADAEVCIQINILSSIYAFINTYMLNYALQFIVLAQY